MKRLHVAAGVIRCSDGRVLIARRPLDKHQGGLWEFPGGKVEEGETAEAALARELAEELGIGVTAARPLIQVRHDYPDKQILLDVWEVSAFSGEPHGAEGQPLVWVVPEQLLDYAFPAANRPIIAAARLPDRYLITPDGAAPQQLLDGLARALDAGVRLVQLRAPSLSAAHYQALAADALALCAGRANLMLKGPLDWADGFPAAGWHLTAEQLRRHAGQGRPIPAGRWLAASCHDAEELAMATELGVDFVTLSPVLPTPTHPDASPLGWSRVSELLQGFNQPAFVLGGMSLAHLPAASQAGAQGVAAIRALWPAEPA
ncbi:Nudix family hydrolase [Pseudomonas sp. YJ42]|uniref:Nudix family hydrolase n=1 Tax=Pseudomonas sp. YJ42 TaxID=3392115 RepID=UPI0039A162A7